MISNDDIVSAKDGRRLGCSIRSLDERIRARKKSTLKIDRYLGREDLVRLHSLILGEDQRSGIEIKTGRPAPNCPVQN